MCVVATGRRPRSSPTAKHVAKKKRGFPLVQATRAFQDNLRRSGPVAGASYTLVGAILLLGGLGYAFDGWAATAPWGLVTGLALGIIVGFYELIKTVWPR
jgi:F0F1-type ATP synthase assembly protein I